MTRTRITAADGTTYEEVTAKRRRARRILGTVAMALLLPFLLAALIGVGIGTDRQINALRDKANAPRPTATVTVTATPRPAPTKTVYGPSPDDLAALRDAQAVSPKGTQCWLEYHTEDRTFEPICQG
jgi:hypothetical protein